MICSIVCLHLYLFVVFILFDFDCEALCDWILWKVPCESTLLACSIFASTFLKIDNDTFVKYFFWVVYFLLNPEKSVRLLKVMASLILPLVNMISNSQRVRKEAGSLNMTQIQRSNVLIRELFCPIYVGRFSSGIIIIVARTPMIPRFLCLLLSFDWDTSSVRNDMLCMKPCFLTVYLLSRSQFESVL